MGNNEYRHFIVKGRARDGAGQLIDVDEVTYALPDEAGDRTLIEKEYELYGDATHSLMWVNEPTITPKYAAQPVTEEAEASDQQQPSKAALTMAETIVRMVIEQDHPDCTLVIADVELYSVNASQGFMADMCDTMVALQQNLAIAFDSFAQQQEATRETKGVDRELKKAPPSCYRCGGSGYITHFGRGLDDGKDIDLNCPVCNPKYGRYDDRDY